MIRQGQAWFASEKVWQDEQGWFAVMYFVRAWLC
jgi:hypothetical protein